MLIKKNVSRFLNGFECNTLSYQEQLQLFEESFQHQFNQRNRYSAHEEPFAVDSLKFTPIYFVCTSPQLIGTQDPLLLVEEAEPDIELFF